MWLFWLLSRPRERVDLSITADAPPVPQQVVVWREEGDLAPAVSRLPFLEKTVKNDSLEKTESRKPSKEKKSTQRTKKQEKTIEKM